METNEKEDVPQTEGVKRERSTIEFPYTGLEDAIAVAGGIQNTTASMVCQHEQLAAALGLSMNSSGYRLRVSAARHFGLTESSPGGVKLTPLGQMIVDSVHEREAKVRAFLNVPLFKAIYEQNRGKQLPPPAALEREMAGLGVAEKQKERARQVFQRSAEVAGFFEMDRTRLIMPPGAGADVPPPSDDKKVKEVEKNGSSGGSGGGDGTELGLDALLVALLKKIPAPDKGWPGPARVRWFRTFAMNVSQIYDGDGDPVEMKIELEKDAAG